MASRRRRHVSVARALLVCGALGCTAVAPSAWAQGATPSAADKETARSLMRTGDAKYAKADYAGAVADYRAADLIMGVPTTRLPLAKAQAKLGQLLEARDSALSVARIRKVAGEPPAFDGAREEASALARALAGRVPSLKLVISGADPSAVLSVTVDGKPVPAGLIGVPRKANPGGHAVVVKADGYETVKQIVQLKEGEQHDVPIALRKTGEPPATVPPAPGPGAPPEPSPGSETGTAPTPVGGDASEQPSSGGLSPLVWVGFGVGAAGLAVGAITGAVAAGKASDLRDRCPDDSCPRAETEDDYDSTYTMAHVSTVGFVVGGAGAALGLVALFAFSGDDEPDTATITVQPSIGLGTLGITGRF